jgi:predicted RND superfamily exporter protein
MISADTLRFLFQGIRVVGFLDAILLMPLAVVLAIVGAFRLIQQENRSAMVWIGASLAMVGLNYSIYVIYSYFANSLNSLPLVDVWTIPLLGLGTALIINSRKIKP